MNKTFIFSIFIISIFLKGCNFAQSGLVGTATGEEATYHFRCAR